LEERKKMAKGHYEHWFERAGSFLKADVKRILEITERFCEEKIGF
jgi:hypothetical protein